MYSTSVIALLFRSLYYIAGGAMAYAREGHPFGLLTFKGRNPSGFSNPINRIAFFGGALFPPLLKLFFQVTITISEFSNYCGLKGRVYVPFERYRLRRNCVVTTQEQVEICSSFFLKHLLEKQHYTHIDVLGSNLRVSHPLKLYFTKLVLKIF